MDADMEKGDELREPDELRLARYVEQRLETAEQEAVQDLLRRTPAARRTADALREENRLLREALEGLSEPPLKIGDRVMLLLYAEQREREARRRARLWRNRMLVSLSAAAVLLLALYSLGPEKEAGRVLSGTGASLARGRTTAPIAKDAPLYEGDTLILGPAQFVRLSLADGTVADVDEDARLAIANGGGAPLLELHAGRARFRVAPGSDGLVVRSAFGYVRGKAEAIFEVWLARPLPVRLPDWTGAWLHAATKPYAPKRGPALCLTVLEGGVYVQPTRQTGETEIGANRRAVFGPDVPPDGGFEFSDWQALDSRREPWHWQEGKAPPGLGLLGMLPPFDWLELGLGLGLTEGVFEAPTATAAIRTALDTLAKAETPGEPAARAEALSQGQQQLRLAAQALPLGSEIRWRARVMEGLAHYERGRALLALGTPKARSDAQSAFLAAAVAFEEALTGGGLGATPVPGAAPGLIARSAPKLEPRVRLADLLPGEQALLLAQFYKPWSLYQCRLLWAAPPAGEAPRGTAEDPLPAFEAAIGLLDNSVEALGARYGQACALAQAGRAQEALALFLELTAASMAGVADGAREQAEGIRQAAHVEAARLYCQLRQWKKARGMGEAFELRYPLSPDGPTARALQEILKTIPDSSDPTTR